MATLPRFVGILAALFVVAGALHFALPQAYSRIVPPMLPNAPLLVAVSGGAEMLGGIGLLPLATRRWAGWGLVALLVAVFPANVYMWQQAQVSGAAFAWRMALLLRLPLQAVLIRWVWRAANTPNADG